MMKFFEATTSDKGILKQEVLRQVVYQRAEELMVFKAAVPLQNMDTLEFKMTLPKVTRFTPEEVAEGALANFQMMEWFETNGTMKKEQVRILVTDEAKARMQADIQIQKSIEAAARGLAWSKDTDIVTVLKAGAGDTHAAPYTWANAASQDITNDIATAIESILTNTYLTESDITNMNMFYPMGLWGHLQKPLGTSTPNQTMVGYVNDKYRVNFIGTRQLSTEALLVINSPETAFHATYTGDSIPTAEEQRLPGVGNQYILTQYYKTFIMPEAENGTTNRRIYKITAVNS